MDLTVTIEPDDYPNWWVDSSYDVHQVMKSHSGIYMILTKEVLYSRWYKQKHDTKSSMEAEFVAKDAMGQILWIRHFYQLRDTTYLLPRNTKTTRAKSYLPKMGRPNLANACIT